MAFTEAQRVNIRLYLGFPDVMQGSDPRLEGAMDIIGTRAATQTIVEACLTQLAAADVLVNSLASAGGLKKVDEVEWYQSNGGQSVLNDARSNGRMWASRLSTLMGVPLVGDAFGTRGYQGDSMFGAAFQMSSNVVPLG